jgi:hypothetical protein
VLLHVCALGLKEKQNVRQGRDDLLCAGNGDMHWWQE